jgi:branched-chain amino acid transport system ATP-binding protein
MLQVRRLMVFYENMLAINNVDLEVPPERIVGVFGSNSAGKSTLMYTLSGIILDMRRKEEMAGGERITVAGEILYRGEHIENLGPSERARMGIVLCPERRRIFPESSVLDNLKIGAFLATKEQARSTLEFVFSLFPKLREIRRRPGGFLSGGEQQMLAIGRALMAQPRLLLLDEPLMGLSPLIQFMLMEAVKQIRQERRISILITEQYARPVLPVVDEGYVLEHGSVVLRGTGQELLENPDVTSAYFGV